jgi:hypothetical protein
MIKNNLFMKTSRMLYILVLSSHLLIASNNENAPIIQPGAPGYPSKFFNGNLRPQILQIHHI